MFSIYQYTDNRNRTYHITQADKKAKFVSDTPIYHLIPSYNSDDYIDYTVKSFQKQTDKTIVVDNGSSDTTINVLKKHGIDPLVILDKGNISTNMNLLLEMVPKNTWVIWSDADDVLMDLPDNFLRAYADYLYQNKCYCSDVRVVDFIYNYSTLFAGFDWGMGPGNYYTARRLFYYTGKEKFKNPAHFNISNTETGDIVEFNQEHTNEWNGIVMKTHDIQFFHYAKCRGVERKRQKDNIVTQSQLIDGEAFAKGIIPTIPYYGKHPSVMEIK